MMKNLYIRKNELLADDFIQLFKSVGWEPPCESQVECAIKNSVVVFSIYSNEELIGMARLLGDLAMSYYVKDFIICPKYQKQGAGTFLMRKMIDYIVEQLSPGWKVSLELISASGVEGFYRKFNFEERPCSYAGAGMFRMVGRK